VQKSSIFCWKQGVGFIISGYQMTLAKPYILSLGSFSAEASIAMATVVTMIIITIITITIITG
jgi:hypothetical protein